MDLVRLIYVSSADHAMNEAELKQILDTAVSRNKEVDVTGMLLYSDGGFMQVLEGPRAAVDEIYARICVDDRHHNILRLCTDAITERDFSRWNMGFKRITESEIENLEDFAPFFSSDFQPEKHGIKAGTALRVLKEFAAHNY